MGISLIAASHLISGTMVRRRPDYRQACSEIDAVLECQCLERCKSLVVVHGQSGIELGIMSKAEDTVGRLGAERHYSLLIGSLDGRRNDPFFLIPEKASVAAVRVETKYCDLGLDHSEIPLQR